MTAQSLAEYQWKNRLVVIISESENSEEFLKQMQEFDNKDSELNDRKLKIILAKPGEMKVLFPENTEWQKSSIYSEMKKDGDFEVLLIGLDGGIKLRQHQVLEAEKLFSQIDSMPMRRAEMNNNDQ